jgi:Fic family protein
MFNPGYSITSKLLNNIKRITELVAALNHQRFPRVILVSMEKKARTLSSHSSTAIEGNRLPLTEVKRILKSSPKNLAASQKEVINYNRALIMLNRLIKTRSDLALSLILKIHKQIMTGLIAAGRWGKLRTEPVFVNDPQTGQPTFLPPDQQDVRRLIEDLLRYTKDNAGTIDPIILAGIFHKQFVIIHPFMDGNGRTARLATKILLTKLGVNTFNLFSFENFYNQNVTNYFQSVGVFGNYYDIKDSIDFTSWLEYFSDGIAAELIRVKTQLEAASAPLITTKPHYQIILNHIKKTGFITNKEYAKLTGRAKPTRNIDFNNLIKLGLIERKGKGRSVYYQIKSS